MEAGVTTNADLNLTVNETNASITVEGESPQIRYDSHTVGGVVTERQIQGLPSNGRSFLESAKLEPGVQPPVAHQQQPRVCSGSGTTQG